MDYEVVSYKVSLLGHAKVINMLFSGGNNA